MAAQSGPDQETRALRHTVEQLKSEVLRLQRELGELHDSDLNALRRAHTTLCHHIQALEEEKVGVRERIAGLDSELITPESIGTELGVAGGTVAALYFAGRLLRKLPVRDVSRLRRGAWLLGSAYLGWRLLTRSVRRLGFWAWDNHRHKYDALQQWQTIEDRIEIMSSLTHWAPPPVAAASDVTPFTDFTAVDMAGVPLTGVALSPDAANSRTADGRVHYPQLSPPLVGGSRAAAAAAQVTGEHQIAAEKAQRSQRHHR